jgi:hypothetical protein
MIAKRPLAVVGVFEDQAHATAAIRDLLAAGFTHEHLALLAREWQGDLPPNVRVDLQNAAGEGATVGAVAGGGLGAAAGLVGASLIPGVGPVLWGGLLIGALTGAVAGATAGGFLGPFIAMEMSDSEARRHASHIEAGRTVVVVRTADRQEEARTILLKHGAYDDGMSAGPRTSPAEAVPPELTVSGQDALT